MKKKIKEFFNLSKKEMINIKGGDETSYEGNADETPEEVMEGDRQFTLVSNIMKVKHDTAKSAINNVR